MGLSLGHEDGIAEAHTPPRARGRLGKKGRKEDNAGWYDGCMDKPIYKYIYIHIYVYLYSMIHLFMYLFACLRTFSVLRRFMKQEIGPSNEPETIYLRPLEHKGNKQYLTPLNVDTKYTHTHVRTRVPFQKLGTRFSKKDSEGCRIWGELWGGG